MNFSFAAQLASRTATSFHVAAANGNARTMANRLRTILFMRFLLCGFGCELTYFAEPRQRERPQRQLHIADGDIVEHAGGDEVDGDGDQPEHDEVSADSRQAGQNGQAGDHLDDAHDMHERRRADRQNARGQRAEIHGPVGQQVEELIESGEKCRRSQTDAQDPKHLVDAAIHFFLLPIRVRRPDLVTVSPFSRCGLYRVGEHNVTAALEPKLHDSLSDVEIVRRMLAGERSLFELILRRYNQRIYRAVRAMVRDESEAEDVMQQAYVNAYTHLHQFAERASFTTWLTRIAINEALARVRPRELTNDTVMDTIESRAPDPEEQAVASELRNLVEAEIAALPERYRS